MTSSTDTLEKLIQQLTNNVNTLGSDIKKELEKLDDKIDKLNVSVNRLEEKVIGLDTRITLLEGKVNLQGNWFLGILTVLVGGLLTLLAKVGFFPEK